MLIAADHQTTPPDTPNYSLLLSSDADLIEAAQRLRHDVFTSEPGFSLAGAADGRDVDRFDEFCDHLLVREDRSGELVGCYRMLPPPGAIAAGGLYTATEFDVSGLDGLRPSLVEMGRAVVREDHRNGAVVLLMWAGILAYLDRCGYDYVAGCVSVPTHPGDEPGSQLRGVRPGPAAEHVVYGEQVQVREFPHVLGGRVLRRDRAVVGVAVPGETVGARSGKRDERHALLVGVLGANPIVVGGDLGLEARRLVDRQQLGDDADGA